MSRYLLSLLAAALFTQAHAVAGELDDLAETLRKGGEALASPAEGGAKPDAVQQQWRADGLRAISEFDQALIRADALAAQAAAGRLEGNPALPQPLRETAGRLRRELPALLDAREEDFVATVEKLLARAREQCLAAQKEAELLPLLREASQLDQGRLNPRSPYSERAMRKLKATVALLRAWMDHLAAKETGDSQRAASALQRLASDTQPDGYPIIPVAEVRRRMEEINPQARPPLELSGQMRDLLVRVKTIRDVPVLAPEIAALPRLPQALYLSQNEQDSLQRWFAGFAAATAALTAGDHDDAWKRAGAVTQVGSEAWAAEAIRLRSLFVGELVAKCLPLAPGQERRPDETTADHLLRIARDAARGGRWEEVDRIQQIYRTVVGRLVFQNVPGWWTDTTGLASAYLEGQRLEAAGDPTRAVAAYLRVLRGSGDFVPTAEAQERLRGLLAAQKTTLPAVRARIDAENLAGLMQRLELALGDMKTRNETNERLAQVTADRMAGPAAGGPVAAQMDLRLKKLEAAVEQMAKGAAASEEIKARLGKVETVLAPAIEADPANPGATDGKVRLWLGPDFTVYRSAVPPAVNARLNWVVRFNGKIVLTRTARREMQFNYDGRKPGIYTIYLTEGGENPASNVLDYTLTEETAKKLGPRVIDDDWDRDGARNPPGPRDP